MFLTKRNVVSILQFIPIYQPAVCLHFVYFTVHNGLPNLLLQLAEEEVEFLPDCMESCTMVYVPQIGYMLAIGKKNMP